MSEPGDSEYRAGVIKFPLMETMRALDNTWDLIVSVQFPDGREVTEAVYEGIERALPPHSLPVIDVHDIRRPTMICSLYGDSREAVDVQAQEITLYYLGFLGLTHAETVEWEVQSFKTIEEQIREQRDAGELPPASH